MAIFTDVDTHVAVVRGLVGDVDAADLPALVAELDDDEVRALESVRVAASGVAGARSQREAGHSGLAQKRGHRSPVSLVQEITGTSRTEAAKQVRAGEALLAVAVDGPGDAGAGEEAPRVWHAPLSEALLGGRISTAQHDAILRGLGEPPAVDLPEADPATVAAAQEEGRAAWESAAGQLVDEAACRTVEELAAQARAIRDLLDPDGAQRRFEERFARRSFRTWRDGDGVRHGSFIFDDDGAAWVDAIMDAALAPRHGVRFVDEGDVSRAQEATADPRTDEQFAYDLMIDLVRTGAPTDAESVFGTRQAGVRIIVTEDAIGKAENGNAGVAQLQDDVTTIPASFAAQHACDAGASTCLLDDSGNPLDLGREARLFSAKQKLTLGIRDGGCRWPGCDRPAHYCEAHHIDGWAAGGRTDVDRGILLCRFHHMQLHHGGWVITRAGKGDFILHPPGGAEPIVLTTRLARQYLFRSAAPPPRRMPAA